MRRALFWLIVIDFCAATGVGVLWTAPEPGWAPPTSIVPEIPTVAEVETSEVGIEAEGLKSMTERPLFFASRRPEAEDEPGPEVAVVEQEETIDVSGFFSSADGSAGAILRVDGESRRVLQGETVGRWTLVAVDGLTAELRADDGTSRQLELVRAEQQETAARPAVPPIAQPAPTGRAAIGAPAPADVKATREAYLKAVAAARAANRAALRERRGGNRNP